MHNSSNNKRNSSKIPSFAKTVLGRAFLYILASTFFLQQLQAFSFLNNSFSCNKSSINFLETSNDQETHISVLPPHVSAKTIIEMELAEDDDKHIGEQELYNHCCQRNAGDELAYHSVLQSRYLQLISSVRKQPEVDYFILYHSWKKHIV